MLGCALWKGYDETEVTTTAASSAGTIRHVITSVTGHAGWRADHPQGGDAMSFVYLESWPYDEVADSKSKATDLYDKLRAALEGPTPAVPFPYDAACEVALIETPDWWMVAVGGAPADPKLVDRMETWFEACGGVQQPTTSETHDVGDSSLTEVAVARGWGRVVSSI